MKRTMLLVLFLLVATWPAFAPVIRGMSRSAPPLVAGGGGGGGAAFSDNFDRTDSASLGANWTEAAGDAEISSNFYRMVTAGYAPITSIYNTSTGTAEQYVKATMDGSNAQYPWFCFRYANSGSGYYAIQFDSNTGGVEWYYFANAADTTGDLIGSGTFGSTIQNQDIGVTISGSGSSTVVRLWRNATGLPSAVDNWNGDTTPDITLSDDPATPCDSGLYVGLGGQQGTANQYRLNNFYGGGL